MSNLIQVRYEKVEDGVYKTGFITMTIEQFNKLVKEEERKANERSSISKK